MGVGDGGHGVNLEIFVRTDGGSGFNWSPVSPGWLSIVEPLVGKLFNVISINVRNSSSNFSSWNSSSHLEHVLSDLLVDILWCLSSEKGVVHGVSSSDDLDVIKVMGPDGWEADTAIVHLSGEDFVSEEVVTEKTTVRVSHIVSISSGNINQVSEKSVHGVVLLVDIIEMFSVLVDSVSTEHVLHELESEVILVFDSWSIIEDTNV